MLKFGAARVPLNWAKGIPLAGYINRTQPANGQHMPLYARAVVLSSGTATLCLISAEVLSVDAALTSRVRAAVTRATGIPADAIMLTATHTHASVGGLTHFPVPTVNDAVLGTYSPALVDQFTAAALAAVQGALAAQVDATLSYGVALTHGIAANRRDPHGAADPTAPFLIARDANQHTIGGIFSFACHPTILSADNLLYSGDLIGTAAAELEAHWGHVLPLTGAAGDISTRFTRRESTTAEVERMAQSLAEAILTAPRHLQPDETLAFARQPITLPVKPLQPRAALEHALEDAQSRLDALPNPAERRVVEAEIEGLHMQLSMGERPAALTSEVQVFRVGGAYILSLPGEFFVEYGLELAQTLAPAPLLIAGYANDYLGYVTTPQAATGYEADTAVLLPAAGRIVLNAAAALARQLQAHTQSSGAV